MSTPSLIPDVDFYHTQNFLGCFLGVKSIGRLSQLFWFLNMDELPTKRERDMIFTSCDVESEEVKRLRREFRSRVRRERKEGQAGLFDDGLQ